MLLSFEVTVGTQPPLPQLVVEDGTVVIGTGREARVRLHGDGLTARHVVVTRAATGLELRAFADVRVTEDGPPLALDAAHAVTLPATLWLPGVRIAIALIDAAASSPRRTASLARELLRGMMADAPGARVPVAELVIERGPRQGQRRALPPVDGTLTIGRGDDAGWIVVDPDLSRLHVEVRRDWDGLTVRDLGSKNGATLDDATVGASSIAWPVDGRLTLGGTVIRHVDPVEHALRAQPTHEVGVRAAAPPSGVVVPVPSVPSVPPVAVVDAAPRPRALWLVWVAVAGLAVAAALALAFGA